MLATTLLYFERFISNVVYGIMASQIRRGNPPRYSTIWYGTVPHSGIAAWYNPTVMPHHYAITLQTQHHNMAQTTTSTRYIGHSTSTSIQGLGNTHRVYMQVYTQTQQHVPTYIHTIRTYIHLLHTYHIGTSIGTGQSQRQAIGQAQRQAMGQSTRLEGESKSHVTSIKG